MDGFVKIMNKKQTMSEDYRIKNVNAMELWVGSNKIILLEGNIVHITAVGLQDQHIIYGYADIHGKLVSSIKGRVSYLIDLNQSGKTTPQARAVWKYLAERKDTYKLAFVGCHPVAEVLAHFAIYDDLVNKMRFFTNEEEGLLWLKE